MPMSQLREELADLREGCAAIKAVATALDDSNPRTLRELRTFRRAMLMDR
jgi:hypothetical protein